jgi:hypothetical protein
MKIIESYLIELVGTGMQEEFRKLAREWGIRLVQARLAL